MHHETTYTCIPCGFRGTDTEADYCPQCGKKVSLYERRLPERQLRRETMQDTLPEPDEVNEETI